MRYFVDKKNKSVMKSQVRALTLNRISICLGLNRTAENFTTMDYNTFIILELSFAVHDLLAGKLYFLGGLMSSETGPMKTSRP